jgi:N6-adenosine-specific RNA methylase IME4
MIPFHPLANLFPMIEGADFDRLVADVRGNGLLDKIVYLDGQILDGRNRYRACIAAGLFTDDERAEPGMWFREFSRAGGFPPDVIERGPLPWVLSKNLSRRHLNESQRAAIANNLATMRQGERTDLKPGAGTSAELPIGDQPSANLPKVSQADAAKMLNVSPRLVRDAKTVKEKGPPELSKAVDQGKISVSAAAKAAKLTPDQQNQVAHEADAGHANVVRTVIKKAARAEREAVLGAKQQALPQKRYGLIFADPEWNWKAYSQVTGMDRAAENHYPTSSVEEIAGRDVASIAADDSICLLCCVDPLRGLQTLQGWGFKYVSYLVWVKDIVEQGVIEEGDRKRRIFVEQGPAGTGYWNRDRDELVLIGTRGNIPAPAMGEQWESVIFAARPLQEEADRGRHSAKPDALYVWAETFYPNLPKIELNARKARPGWDRWGNEAPVSSNENDQPGDMLGDAGAPGEENFEFPPEVEEPSADGDNEFADELPSVSEMLRKTEAVEPEPEFDPDRDLPSFLRRKTEPSVPNEGSEP